MKRKLAEIVNIIFGFRKFLFMMLLFLVAVIFRVKGLVSGGEFVDLLKATTLGFFSVNGIEHLVGAVNNYTASKATPIEGPADTDESNDNEDVK